MKQSTADRPQTKAWQMKKTNKQINRNIKKQKENKEMTNEFEKNNMAAMTEQELEEVTGGKNALSSHGRPSKNYRKVKGLSSGYLALRSAPCYDSRNEIGKLYNGDKVILKSDTIYVKDDFNKNDSTPYVYVHACDLNMDGWVNKSFLHHC